MLTDRANFKKAQQTALELLDQFGYTVPPVFVVDIAHALGIRVYFSEFDISNNQISGFFYHVENAIYVNKDEFPPRQLFTIAHELGHKLLHEDYLKSSRYKFLMRSNMWNSSDPIEQEANAFAANLLVPKYMLDEYRNFGTVSELAKLFAVSEPVVQNRLKFEYGRQ